MRKKRIFTYTAKNETKNCITKVIESTILVYAVDNLVSNLNINNLPLQDIKFSIDDSLFFDVLLMEIRGKTISYASYKTKTEENKEKLLQEEIDKLEKENNINFAFLDTKRKELYEIRQKKNGRSKNKIKSKMGK